MPEEPKELESKEFGSNFRTGNRINEIIVFIVWMAKQIKAIKNLDRDRKAAEAGNAAAMTEMVMRLENHEKRMNKLEDQ